jgi:hypothetical protein
MVGCCLLGRIAISLLNGRPGHAPAVYRLLYNATYRYSLEWRSWQIIHSTVEFQRDPKQRRPNR